MAPTLANGDLLVASSRIAPHTGDVVVVRERGIEMIKRMTSVHAGAATIEGDDPASTRFVTGLEDVAAVVLARYWPAPRLLRRR